MRKALCLLLLLCLLAPLCAGAEKYQALPVWQQLSQTVQRERSGNLYVDAAYPHTMNAAVDAEMAALIDDMLARARPHMPARPAYEEGAFLNVGASVYRTGESWMSFLTVADVLDDREQQYVDFDARAYDMATGARLTLNDFLADEAGWALVSEAVFAQLAAYYPAEAADAQALAALCAREALEETPFTLSVAFLQLHFRADALYAGKNTLMHVRVPYADLREHMTEAALRQTDNSAYKLVALTYDDGPVRVRTQKLLRHLRAGGANATFFIVGDRIRIGHDILCLMHDAGFCIASHNYEHIYGYKNRYKVVPFRDRLNEELGRVTGAQVHLMRAPGGDEKVFIEERVDLPLLHWSFVSHSVNGVVPKPESEARRLAGSVQDGEIVLLHDLYTDTDTMAETLPQLLAERGFLCVTVEELFAARGLTLEPNTVYYHAKVE